MRRDKISMKSILEEARAMRTASLEGRKKNEKPVPSRNVSPNNDTHAKILQSPSMLNSQSQIMVSPPQITYNNRLSGRFSQADSMNSQSRFYFDPPTYTRTYFDNESMSVTNLAQSNPYSRMSCIEARKVNINEMGAKFLGKLNQLLSKNLRKPQILLKQKRRIQECIGLFERKSEVNILKFLA